MTRFQDVLTHHARWFQGDARAPAILGYYGSKPEPETLHQLDAFLTMHTCGFLTVDSQDGLSDAKKDQRAYCCGFMHADLAVQVEAEFQEQSGVLVHVSSIDEPLPRCGVVVTYVAKKATTRAFLGAGDLPTWVTQLEEDVGNRPLAKEFQNLREVTFVDMEWGRQGHLMTSIAKVLRKLTA